MWKYSYMLSPTQRQQLGETDAQVYLDSDSDWFGSIREMYLSMSRDEDLTKAIETLESVSVSISYRED